MKNFKPGEEVISLINQPNPKGQLLKKGARYVVNKSRFCPIDGHQSINVDGRGAPYPAYTCNCGHHHETKGWLSSDSKHFIRPEDLQASIEEAIEHEEYEKVLELKELEINKQTD